ncbi:T9SS type A sorting domain-containing protein [Chryseobacterium camelliae]|uniref:T9SS type A sorting domain-containing protein n=1 Tax=Chryseobacterium camelliae TaxID=1265445 RepID=A0ABY7QLP4_9FLAO|nr:T9SS type A sorting domain-containing protein [Chryseobacterium camelliae]WBV60148.1 T9SS type A sorting domain-containing protein [Chryseobacterium camelliae]
MSLAKTYLQVGQHRIYAVNLQASSSSVVYNMIYDGYATGRSFWGIQRNHRNEIYISSPYYEYLSKITNPDTYGASGLNLDEIYLQGKKTYLGLPQQLLMTNIVEPECIPYKILQNTEPNVDYIHAVSDYIIASDNYSVNAGNGHIGMKAGNYIKLLPNTYIKGGSDFLATIAPCKEIIEESIQKHPINHQEKVSLTLDLTNNVDTEIVNVYPNPASDFIKIDTKTKVLAWELYDISGKIVLKGNSDKIDVKSMTKGAYVLSVTIEKGIKVSKKIIVK